MTQGKVHFRGILAITDSSITNIKLDYGFKIEKMDIDTAKSFISLWPTYKHNALFDKGCVVKIMFITFPIHFLFKIYRIHFHLR